MLPSDELILCSLKVLLELLTRALQQDMLLVKGVMLVPVPCQGGTLVFPLLKLRL